MKFLHRLTSTDELEKNVKNKWRWQWFDQIFNDVKVSVWCRKVEQPGTCFCVACGKTVLYGSSGKKAIRDHALDSGHEKNLNSLTGNCRLPFAEETMPGVTVDPITERTQDVKGRIGLFVAEHCLPFSISGPLLDLVKHLSQDIEAVNNTKMERTACTYTITHGIARAVKRELGDKLKGSFFSLNIDEATNHAKDKVLNILVQFFDEERGKFVIELLGSRVVNLANAQNIFNAVDNVLQEYDLNWAQVVSVLMDNCNVMRGLKGGVEAKIKEANPHLMDISGDTVHMLNISANSFFDKIEAFHPIQPALSSIYFDIQDSPKMKNLFNSLQEIVFGKSNSLSILRPLPTRFLQMHEVTERILKLWDVLWIFYYGSLPTEEKKTYTKELTSLFTKYNVDETKQSELVFIWKSAAQNKSPAGIKRLANISLFFFRHKVKSLLLLKLYKGILGQFKGYVLKFQSEKPLAHTLHTSMFIVIHNFFKGFIRPSKIPESNVKELSQLDFKNESLQVSPKSVSVGPDAFEDLMIMQKDIKFKSWLGDFHKALLNAYLAGAEKMLKLPLCNKTLLRLAAFSPDMQRSDSTSNALMNLAKSLPQVVPPSELGALDQELREYTTDRRMSVKPYDGEEPATRIDTDWYCHLFSLRCQGQQVYSKLSKLVKAALSCFSGPLVEGTFNIMDDILEKDRARMTAENFEALLSVKQSLKASGCTAVTYPISAEMRNMIRMAYSTSVKDKPLKASNSHPQPSRPSKRKAVTSDQPHPSTSAQQLPSTSAQQLPSTSAQQLSSTSAQQLPSTSDQQLPSTSAQQLSSTSAQQFSSTSAQQIPSSNAIVDPSPRPFKKTKATSITAFFKKA